MYCRNRVLAVLSSAAAVLLAGAADVDAPGDSGVEMPSAFRELDRLEASHQHEDALALGRRVLADPRATSATCDQLQDRVAFNLFNLHHIDEGVRAVDRRIADAVDDPSERLRLLELKAELLLDHAEAARGIGAWREFRHATEPFSPRWETATAMLALELARDGQHREAIDLRGQLIHHLRNSQSVRVSTVWIDIARSQQAMGWNREARVSLSEAERAMRSAVLEHGTESAEIDGLRGQIANLRERMRRTR